MTLELCITIITLATDGTKQSKRIHSKNQMIHTLTLTIRDYLELAQIYTYDIELAHPPL